MVQHQFRLTVPVYGSIGDTRGSSAATTAKPKSLKALPGELHTEKSAELSRATVSHSCS